MNVSRETIERLTQYKELVLKWQKTINLVSTTSLSEIEERHFKDSLQLINFIPTGAKKLIDLGSGGGFPGMVIALTQTIDVTLVESDLRKCLFLKNVSRETKSSVKILQSRIESIKEKNFDVITSRALASLDQLCEYSFPLIHSESILLFLKGKNFQKEIDDSRFKWDYELEVFNSKTNPDARVLKISYLKKREKHD